MNTLAALEMNEAASTFCMLSSEHACCTACIAESTEMIVLYAMCLNGTNAKEDVTFGADGLALQAKAVPESEVQETSEPRCHL